MDEHKPTHRIDIIVHGLYPHGPAQQTAISVSGDGGIEHMLDAFKTALVAAGFALDTAKKLDQLDL